MGASCVTTALYVTQASWFISVTIWRSNGRPRTVIIVSYFSLFVFYFYYPSALPPKNNLYTFHLPLPVGTKLTIASSHLIPDPEPIFDLFILLIRLFLHLYYTFNLLLIDFYFTSVFFGGILFAHHPERRIDDDRIYFPKAGLHVSRFLFHGNH